GKPDSQPDPEFLEPECDGDLGVAQPVGDSHSHPHADAGAHPGAGSPAHGACRRPDQRVADTRAHYADQSAEYDPAPHDQYAHAHSDANADGNQ
ncbi:MAG TPA: hypothetical protein PLP55_13825, partial [Phycicoccus elongatus]|uniref:hypothetical protein n=1 Tax=Phycicoccus elongatus TaxID=101689 RepID=UPI002B5C521F